MGIPYTFDEWMSGHSTRIELFYFDDNFRHIAEWVLPFRLNVKLCQESRYQFNLETGFLVEKLAHDQGRAKQFLL